MSAADKAVAAGGDVGGSSILLNQPIVIDNGTSSVKAGFAGGSKPKVNSDGVAALLIIVEVNPNRFYVDSFDDTTLRRYLRLLLELKLEERNTCESCLEELLRASRKDRHRSLLDKNLMNTEEPFC
jgi:Actin